MSEEVYRRVMCSNRNPKEKGLYQTNAGTCSYKGGNSWAFGSKSFDIQFWYERVVLPIEEQKLQVVEWLKDKHKIHLEINYCGDKYPTVEEDYDAYFYSINGISGSIVDTYEEALDEGIEEAIKLINHVNRK